MEINIKNAFQVAVKLSCRPCFVKYRILTENIQELCLQMIHFLLKRPLLTTVLFSVFMIQFIIVLSVAFILLLGVFVFVIIILLVEGFLFIVFATVICMIIATATLIIMIVVGIKYKLSTIHNLD